MIRFFSFYPFSFFFAINKYINAYLWQLAKAFGPCRVPYHRTSDHRITDQRSWNRLPQWEMCKPVNSSYRRCTTINSSAFLPYEVSPLCRMHCAIIERRSIEFNTAVYSTNATSSVKSSVTKFTVSKCRPFVPRPTPRPSEGKHW